jgi:hypothetical protein
LARENEGQHDGWRLGSARRCLFHVVKHHRAEGTAR